jgi:hypothetical protein
MEIPSAMTGNEPLLLLSNFVKNWNRILAMSSPAVRSQSTQLKLGRPSEPPPPT